jgi:hypothetical protein
MSKKKILQSLLEQRILVLDGAMGTMIQKHKLSEKDYRGERFKDWHVLVQGNNDLLSLTQPKIIQDIHRSYLEVGADIATKVVPIAKQVAPLIAGAGKSDLDKAKESLQKYVDGKKKTKPSKKHLDLLEQHGVISKTQEAGKVNRLRKAKKWTDYSVDTASKGLDLAEKGMKVFGGTGYSVSGGKVNSAKKTSPWIVHVKKVAETQGVSYKEALKIASASYKKK